MFGNILRELQQSLTAAAAVLVLLLILYFFRGRRAVNRIAAWFVALGMGALGCHPSHKDGRSAAESPSRLEAKQEKADTSQQAENRSFSTPEDTASGTEEKTDGIDTAVETNDSQSKTGEPLKKEAETNSVALNFARLEQAPGWVAFKELWKKIHGRPVGVAKNRAMQNRLRNAVDKAEAYLMTLSEQNIIHEMHVISLASILKNRIHFTAGSCSNALMMSHTIPSEASVSDCMEMSRFVDRIKALRKLKKRGHVNSETYLETMSEIVSGTVALYYWNFLVNHTFGGGLDRLDATASLTDWQKSAAQIRELCGADYVLPNSYDKQRCEQILSKLDTLEHLKPEIELLVHALEK